MRMTDPAVTFLLIVIIGIVAGLLFDRLAGPSWLARQFTGSTRGIVTSSLIGIAGAFIGSQIVLLIVSGGGLVGTILGAAVGALAALALWRMVK